MADKGELPKNDGDILYGSEANIALLLPFGDGSDGSVTISSNTDVGHVTKNYTDLTIDNTFTLTVASRSVIYVSGTLTINGTIAVDQELNISSGGVSDPTAGGAGGAGGASGGAVHIFAKNVAGNGTINSNGVVGVAGANGVQSTPDRGGADGNDGGNGRLFYTMDVFDAAVEGKKGSLQTGGTATVVPSIHRNLNFARNLVSFGNDASGGGEGELGDVAAIGGGGGGAGASLGAIGGDGGAGNAGATTGTQGKAGGGGGGGGGCGGFIFMHTLTNTSTVAISTNGGNGGAGGNGDSNSGSGTNYGGGAGGGGGGSGGFIVIFSDTNTFTTSVTAGSGGAAGNNSDGGGTGTAGSVGTVGVAFENIGF